MTICKLKQIRMSVVVADFRQFRRPDIRRLRIVGCVYSRVLTQPNRSRVFVDAVNNRPHSRIALVGIRRRRVMHANCRENSPVLAEVTLRRLVPAGDASLRCQRRLVDRFMEVHWEFQKKTEQTEWESSRANDASQLEGDIEQDVDR